MKLFIWALCITSFLQFFTARYAKILMARLLACSTILIL